MLLVNATSPRIITKDGDGAEENRCLGLPIPFADEVSARRREPVAVQAARHGLIGHTTRVSMVCVGSEGGPAHLGHGCAPAWVDVMSGIMVHGRKCGGDNVCGWSLQRTEQHVGGASRRTPKHHAMEEEEGQSVSHRARRTPSRRTRDGRRAVETHRPRFSLTLFLDHITHRCRRHVRLDRSSSLR